jgi:mycobactin peptide synthetase MbtF
MHAHVVVQRRHGVPRLTAYVAADPAPTESELHAMLAKWLPRYMVPHRIVVVDEMPLTSHGKIDEAALTALPQTDDEPTVEPETATEAALAELLAEILKCNHIDVTADFVRLGLDSIVALSVVQAARRRGIALRARLMLECGTIRELGAAIDNESAVAERVDDGGDGPVAVLPNVRWLYEHGDARRLAQTHAVRLPENITRLQLHTLLTSVIESHEMLRTRLDLATMTLVGEDPPDILTEVQVTGDMTSAVAEQTRLAVERLDPQQGSLLSAVWLRESGGASVLVFTAHVLAMDPASWRIVLGELDSGWQAVAAGDRPAAVREYTTYRQWSRLLEQRATSLDTCDFWVTQLEGDDPELGARRVRPHTDRAADVTVSLSIADTDVTARLLSAAQPTTHLLAAAAALTVTRWRRHRGQDTPPPLLALETHGRADGVVDHADTSDTVGLLSAIYPMRVRSAKDLNTIPGDGIDYGLLRYLRPDTADRLRAHPEPQLLLNFLGNIHVGAGGDTLKLEGELLAEVSPLPEPELAVRHELTIIAAVTGDADTPMLATQWRTLPDILAADDIAILQSMWHDSLKAIAS